MANMPSWDQRSSLAQCQHGRTMLAPDALPLDPEPWGEPAALGSIQLGLERGGSYPTPVVDLGAVGAPPAAAAPDEDRAQPALRGSGIKLRLVLELEQEVQCTLDTELRAQAAVNRRLHALGAPRMTAAAVGPVQGPQPLPGGSLLQQQLAMTVEYQQ